MNSAFSFGSLLTKVNKRGWIIENKKNRIRFLMIGLMLLILGILGWRMLGQKQEEKKIQPYAVSTDRVRFIEKPAVKPLSGTVEGLTSSIISSRFSGQVTQVYVEDGQPVAKGQPLFLMDTVELENGVRIARNQVNQAEASYRKESKDYQRFLQLFQQGAYPRQQLDSQYAQMLSSQADLDSARANLSNAEKQLTEATVVSPVNGVVAHKALTHGQNVSSGSQVMTVEQMDAVYVVIHVEQKDMAFLKMGKPVDVTVDACPDRIFTGSMEVISPVAGKESRMFRVKLRVENPEQLLKPGMFVQVQLPLGQPRQVLSVPQKAVLGEKGVQYVFTEEEGKARKVRIKTGDLIDDRIEILEGADEGMVILTDNLDNIKEGDPVHLEESV